MLSSCSENPFSPVILNKAAPDSIAISPFIIVSVSTRPNLMVVRAVLKSTSTILPNLAQSVPGSART